MPGTPTRIAITSEGPDFSDALDPRFGRAGGFVLVDLETAPTTYVDNGSAQVLAQAVTEGPGTPFGAMVRRIWPDLQPLLEAPSPLPETRP